jgi:hypothetical protein
MSSGVIRCDGAVTIASDGAPLCSGVWTLVPVPEPFSLDVLDPVQVAAAFMAGFVIVGSCWFAGWCFRSVLSMIK